MGEYVWFHDVSWHASYAVYFFVIGICAGLFFFSFLSWHKEVFRPLRARAAYLSFALLVVGGLLLISDLSQPLRFLYILNPFYLHLTSPLAWGVLNIVSFGIVSVLYLVALRRNNEALGKSMAAVGALLALGLPVYTGFDLTVHQSRPIWNTPLMPVLFVAMAVVSGAAVASFLVLRDAAALRMLRQYMLWSAGAVGVMLVSLLGTTAYGGAAEELAYVVLTTGAMGLVFVGLGLIAGTAAPIALMLAPFGRQQVALVVSAVLILVGGAALRYALLMGPQIVQTLY
ncbi:MAG: NrfD/PsrC family molybdoenzyme membrane anchor subunit [Pseudomonadota bacterium]|jgi:formate-dependent nitrite reductase membrane component NrfD